MPIFIFMMKGADRLAPVFQHNLARVTNFFSGSCEFYTDLIGNMIKGVRNVMAARRNALL